MAKNVIAKTAVKSPAPVVKATAPAPVQNATAAVNAATNAPVVLTVVVLDDKSQPVSGARVSITPSDTSAVTNNAGEAQFTLGPAIKYNVTATAGSNTVTVPYYVTKNGATRLVVNPKYIKTVEAQLHPSSWNASTIFTTIGIILGVAIVMIIFWKWFQSRYKKVS